MGSRLTYAVTNERSRHCCLPCDSPHASADGSRATVRPLRGFAWTYSPCPLLIRRHSFSPEKAADRLVHRGHLGAEEGTRTWYHHHRWCWGRAPCPRWLAVSSFRHKEMTRTPAHGHFLGFHAPKCGPKKDLYKEVAIWFCGP